MAITNPLRKPLRVGEIIAGAWTIFRRNPNDLLIIGAIAALPNSIGNFVMTPIVERLPAYTAVPEFNLTTNDWLTLAGTATIVFILEFVFVTAVYRAAFDLCETGTFSLRASYLRLVKRLGVLLVVGFFSAFIPFLLGLSVLFSPIGLFLFVGWVVAPAVVLIENVDAIGALKRSWHLVKRNWWHTLWTLLVLFLAVRLLPIVVLYGLFGFLFQNTLSQSLIGFVASAVTTPLFAAGVVALYFDLRARKGEFIGSSQIRTAEPVSPGEGA
jgi:hypothetical protein